MMTRKNFAKISGVIIDWCRDHGYWFDASEIERVLAFLSGGGLDKARPLEAERDRIAIERANRREISETLLAPRRGYESYRTKRGEGKDWLLLRKGSPPADVLDPTEAIEAITRPNFVMARGKRIELPGVTATP